MKKIFVIFENNEIITARDTMDNAIAAAINRIAISGYYCTEFRYEEFLTEIRYYDSKEQEPKTMYIQATYFQKGA